MTKKCIINYNYGNNKDKVQEKIDDYKFSLYDFKAFMADVLKRYSRKQVYSNMEKIISYFSCEHPFVDKVFRCCLHQMLFSIRFLKRYPKAPCPQGIYLLHLYRFELVFSV